MARKSLPAKRDRSTSSPLSDVDMARPKAAPKSASNGVARGRASKAAGMAKSAAALKDDSESLSEEEQPKKKPRASAASVTKGKSKGKEVKEEEAHEDEKCGSCASESEDEAEPKAKGKGKAAGKAGATKSAKAAAGKSKKAANGDADVDADAGAGAEGEEKPKKKAKAKAFPPPDLEPSSHPKRHGYPVYQLPELAVPPNGGIGDRALNRTRPMLLGAHVSIGGGPAGALLRAGKAGANGLAMFVKSQRQWKSNPYEEEAVKNFKDMMKSREEGGMGYGPESVLVHGSYLINLGNPDQTKWQQAYECFRDDLSRCYQLGLRLYNWHPGSTVGACTREESYAGIAKAINMVHKDVPEVICVIENMANAGSNIIGTTFQDLAGIIALVEDKSRVRVCLDTCHLFAAGFDIRTPESYAKVMSDFNDVVGNGYLGGIHLNDSKAGLGEKKDLHENIGLGQIGLSAFRTLMRDPLMAGIPICLETPAADKPLEVGELAVWKHEIELLYRIQRIEDEDWAKEEKSITEEWRKIRDVMNPPKEKKPAGGKGKGKKGKKGESEEEE